MKNKLDPKILTTAMSHVDWQGIEQHTTKGTAKRPSRDRTYLSGIPMDSLKCVYNHKNKPILQRFGFQFFCLSSTPTGEFVQRKHHKIEIKRVENVCINEIKNNQRTDCSLPGETATLLCGGVTKLAEVALNRGKALTALYNTLREINKTTATTYENTKKINGIILAAIESMKKIL